MLDAGTPDRRRRREGQNVLRTYLRAPTVIWEAASVAMVVASKSARMATKKVDAEKLMYSPRYKRAATRDEARKVDAHMIFMPKASNICLFRNTLRPIR